MSPDAPQSPFAKHGPFPGPPDVTSPVRSPTDLGLDTPPSSACKTTPPHIRPSASPRPPESQHRPCVSLSTRDQPFSALPSPSPPLRLLRLLLLPLLRPLPLQLPRRGERGGEGPGSGRTSWQARRYRINAAQGKTRPQRSTVTSAHADNRPNSTDAITNNNKQGQQQQKPCTEGTTLGAFFALCVGVFPASLIPYLASFPRWQLSVRKYGDIAE